MKKQGEIQASLGLRIRSLRQKKGVTQQELGELAGLNYKFLGEIERGLQNPTIQTIYKIAKALGTDLCEVVRIDEEKRDRKSVEAAIFKIIQGLPDEDIGQLFDVLKVLFPLTRDD